MKSKVLIACSVLAAGLCAAAAEYRPEAWNLQARDYERIVDGFYPSKFNAREWVRIVRRSGAKYITITARHCDGFALWPSKVDGYNIVATPFKRDVIGELVEKAVLARKGYAR